MAQLTAYLMVKNSALAIDWYRKVFGAQEHRARLVAPNGCCMNAEICIGDTRIMVADEMPQRGSVSPEGSSGTSVVLNLHVDNADACFQRALDAGATQIFPLADQFYGDRAGRIRDPFGHAWIIATRQRDVPEAETLAAFHQLFGA